jgi:D-glucosaminate-6-phosphate ammonia-lyase
MANRRRFLQAFSTLPLFTKVAPAASNSAQAYAKRDYFAELGIRPFINAAGTFTVMTASLMPPEVMAAMERASRQFVHLPKLQDAVGAKIASMIGAEAAMVTSGAAGAMCCGTAACITGADQKAILQIPDLTGLKNEVIVQKKHRYGYDHAVRACGVKIVEVETADELERARTERTAMMLFANFLEPEGAIKAAEFVKLGKKLGVPTFNDCSADVTPYGRLQQFAKSGFDLVTVSGGKAICGPQSAGILFGRKDLIEAAKLNTSPYSDSIARGMKVNKEEMIGMMVALELFLKRGWDADWKEYQTRAKVIADSVSSLGGITTEVEVPEIANHVPHLHIRWDESRIRISPTEARKALLAGDPSIEVNPASNRNELVIGVWMLQPGEAQIVAKRLREVLRPNA